MARNNDIATEIRIRMLKLGISQPKLFEMLKADGCGFSKSQMVRAIYYDEFQPERERKTVILKKLDELEGEARGSRRVSRDNRKDS